jgi:hypothetical protein
MVKVVSVLPLRRRLGYRITVLILWHCVNWRSSDTKRKVIALVLYRVEKRRLGQSLIAILSRDHIPKGEIHSRDAMWISSSP